MKSSTILAYVVLAAFLLGLCSTPIARTSALTQADISNTDNAIQSAFVSIHKAEMAGGNVSSLVVELDDAIQLVQTAEAENATSPSQATADLANATLISQDVIASAPSIAHAGSAERQTRELASAGAASAIVVLAALAYFFGDRIYRRAWLRLHRDYVVRPANG